MNKKFLWLTVPVMVLGLLSVTRGQAPPISAVGRYQLLDFSKGTYRFDTQTGQAWTLTIGKTPDGKDSLAWMPIPQNARADQ